MRYGTTVTVDHPFERAVEVVREALAAQGFGVLTEIDVAATLKARLDVDVPAQVILGACNPPLAHRAFQAEADVGLLLPCNVVVRALPDGRSVVAAVDPDMMVQVTDNAALLPVAEEAATRLRAALDHVTAA